MSYTPDTIHGRRKPAPGLLLAASLLGLLAGVVAMACLWVWQATEALG